MEGLNVAMEDAVAANLFHDIRVDDEDVSLSHLFYADDVLFVEEWNEENICNLIIILNSFFFISGLKVNLFKSKLYGVGVPNHVVSNLAVGTGCDAASVLFSYLGLPVGSNLTRVDNWDVIMHRFKTKLANWKIQLLSVGGRFSLLKDVIGSLGIYCMSMYKVPETIIKLLESIRAKFFWGGQDDERKILWLKWDVVLNMKENGGLDIGSLKALNIALLYKWLWRFKVEQKALWATVIRSIHGSQGGMVMSSYIPRGSGAWASIIKMFNSLHEKQIVPRSFISRRVGNGMSTRFWHDAWVGDRPLRERFPRLYALEVDKDCNIVDRKINGIWCWHWRHTLNNTGRTRSQFSNLLGLISSIQLLDRDDEWVWELESNGTYTVRSTWKYVDSQLLAESQTTTRWCTLVPIKLNILIWRILVDRIPTRSNLIDRGIDVHTGLCPSCEIVIEDNPHVFVSCDLARTVWNSISRWLDVQLPTTSSVMDVMNWVDTIQIRKQQRQIL